MLTIHDKKFVPYISEIEIKERIKAVAQQIENDYNGQKPLFIAILNGAFMFAADLFRELNMEAEIAFIKLASYKGTQSTGQVITAIGLDRDVHERHVIIVEDIVDTGKTLNAFLPQLQHSQPQSLKIAALLHKPDATVYPVKPHYVCFSIPNKFVVGYGLDFDGLGRNLKEIYQITE
jgi:hypoxanthine phosphoribosyltransferase